MKKRLYVLLLATFMAIFSLSCSENQNAATTPTPTETYSGEMTIDFSFGTRTGIYSGEIDGNGVPSGQGTFTSKNSDGETWTYEGDWVDGHWEGSGTSTWSSGQKYVGEFSNDIENGVGRLDFPDGTHFEGEFADFSNAVGCFSEGSSHFYAKIVDGTLNVGGVWRTGEFGDEINEFQGEWQELDSKYGRVIISGESVNFVSDMDIGCKHYRNVFTYYFGLDDNNELIVVNETDTPRYEIAISEDGILSIIGESKNESYTRISDNIEVPAEKGDPKIGMTELEVYDSAWGYPKRTNKTTTAYGTQKQLVYEDGYVYIENGVVTAIQD